MEFSGITGITRIVGITGITRIVGIPAIIPIWGRRTGIPKIGIPNQVVRCLIPAPFVWGSFHCPLFALHEAGHLE
jgi:hypothetical protein